VTLERRHILSLVLFVFMWRRFGSALGLFELAISSPRFIFTGALRGKSEGRLFSKSINSILKTGLPIACGCESQQLTAMMYSCEALGCERECCGMPSDRGPYMKRACYLAVRGCDQHANLYCQAFEPHSTVDYPSYTRLSRINNTGSDGYPYARDPGCPQALCSCFGYCQKAACGNKSVGDLKHTHGSKSDFMLTIL
jgi:hypothetical protein